MTIPQFALYVIGEDRVTGCMTVSDGYLNSVWCVTTRDGDAFFVKRSRNAGCWSNEVQAHRHLLHRGLPAPILHAALAGTLIFVDAGLRPPVWMEEGVTRGAGRMLRRIHDGSPLPHLAMPAGANTLNLRIVRTARRQGYEPPCPPAPTHGDCHPRNMIVTPRRRLHHLIDFEEFRGGDAMADLMIAAIECCRYAKRRRARILAWLLQGYFAWDQEEPRRSAWRDLRTRMILAQASYTHLLDWAEQNRMPEEATGLAADRHHVLAVIEADATLEHVAAPGGGAVV